MLLVNSRTLSITFHSLSLCDLLPILKIDIKNIWEITKKYNIATLHCIKNSLSNVSTNR